jgi:hypothetical protein
MRRLPLALVSAAAVAALAAPAAANSPSDVTFTVSGSSTLSVSVPTGSAVNLGSGNPGASVSGALGQVTVTDQRARLVASWTASVTASEFTLQGQDLPAELPAQAKVAPSAITYDPGTVNLLLGTVSGSGLSAGTPGAIGAGRTAVTYLGIGNNTVQWTPTLTFALQDTQVEGTYSGTITHSVTGG